MWSMRLITVELGSRSQIFATDPQPDDPPGGIEGIHSFQRQAQTELRSDKQCTALAMKNNGKDKLQSLQMSPKLVNQIGTQETNVSRTFWTAS